MAYTSFLTRYNASKRRPDPELDPRNRDWRDEGFSWMRPNTPAGRLFDILSRGNYATANMALEGGRIVRDEVDDSALGGLWRVLKAGGRGLAGRDKVFYEDVLNEADVSDDWHPLVKTGLGLVGDVALDPNTYWGMGMTKLGRLAKVAASGLDDASKAARFVRGGLETADLTGRSLRQAQRLNRGFEWAQRTRGLGPEDLANIFRGGKAAQAEAGMRGLVNFAGRPLVKGTGVYRGLDRFPRWLAGTMDVTQQSPWMRSMDENAPVVRKRIDQLKKAFTPGNTNDPPIRAAELAGQRSGAVAAARLGRGLEPTMPGLRKAVKGADDQYAVMRQMLDLVETPGGPNRAVAEAQLGIVQDKIARHGGRFDLSGDLKSLLDLEEHLTARLADDISEAVVSGDVQRAADSVRGLFDDSTEIKRAIAEARGYEFKELNQPGARHVPHIPTRAGTNEIAARPELHGLRRIHNLSDPGQQYREIRKPINLANDIIQGKHVGMDMGDVFGPEYAGLTMKSKFFEDNVVALAEVGMSRTGRIVGDSGFIDNLIKDGIVEPISKYAHGAPTGWRRPELLHEAWGKTTSLLDGFVAPHGVATEIENVWHIGHNPQDMNTLLGIYDKALNTWRGYALLAPSYHFRNLFSNIWQNFMGGVRNPEAYAQSARFQWAAHRAPKDGGAALDAFRLATPFGDISGTQLREMLFDEDLLGGFMSEVGREIDIMHMDLRQHSKARMVHESVMHRNLATGTVIENNARFALMFDQLSKGESVTDAAQAVRHFLFDYTSIGLSQFENDVMRRLTSFYRWTKNNMLLSTEQMFKQPGKYAGVAKFKHAIESTSADGAPREDYLPEWMSEGYAVRMPKLFWQDEQTPNYFSLQNWLPAMQVAELFEDVDEHHVPGLSWALGMAAPTISLPLEQAMNKSLFFESPIEEYPGQRRQFLGQSMSPRAVHLLRTVRPLSEINKFMQGKPAGQATQEWLTGRTYPYDRMKQMRISRAQSRRLKSRLKGAWKNALGRGDQAEANRLLKEYLSVQR